MAKNLFKLIDAICEVYSDKSLQPTETETYCNLAVDMVCSKMNYYEFRGLTANQMIIQMENSERWQKIDMDFAQDKANEGNLVIAGRMDSPHGHIVVVRPGNMAHSHKWNRLVPKCINVGKNNFIDKGINFAFIELPRFYLLK